MASHAPAPATPVAADADAGANLNRQAVVRQALSRSISLELDQAKTRRNELKAELRGIGKAIKLLLKKRQRLLKASRGLSQVDLVALLRATEAA